MKAEWFKDRLRELRLAAGLNRGQLALAAGLKETLVRDLEQGLNGPRWDTVVALCLALGVGPQAFLEEPASTDTLPRGRPRKEAEVPEAVQPKPRGRPKKPR